MNQRNRTSINYWRLCLSIIWIILYTDSARAIEYTIAENGSRLIGYDERYEVRTGNYFNRIAQFYDIGLLALIAANPDIDPLLPPVGTKLRIPIRMLLPDQPHRGILINLPEFRLYYFPKNTGKVYVFPIGIGRAGRATPVMHSKIISKIKNPSWTPTARIKADHLKKYGTALPAIVPAGKNNPLGHYALRLAYGANDYLIHGTNQNFGIGMRVSAGCIRMNPEDIAWLFSQVKRNEEVRIINQPVKIATEPNGKIFAEVHAPIFESDQESQNQKDPQVDLQRIKALINLHKHKKINLNAFKEALLLHHGMPTEISPLTFH